VKKQILFSFLALSAGLSFVAHANDMPKWDQGLFEGTSSYDKYFNDYCSGGKATECFDINNDSAILNAIETTADDIYVVVRGDRVITLDKASYAKWQELMEDNLLKAGQGSLKVLYAPVKVVSGVAVSIAGLFYAPFEPKHHHGDLARRGAGLAVDGAGNVATGSIAIADGLTFGGPVYVISLPFTASHAPAKEVLNAIKSTQK